MDKYSEGRESWQTGEDSFFKRNLLPSQWAWTSTMVGCKANHTIQCVNK